MLEIQKYLKRSVVINNYTDELFEDLKNNFGIYTNRSIKYHNLVQFTYDSIEAPKNDPMVKECRGLILDENNDWEIVAFPFTRFFNSHEPNADKIDWSTAKVQEKVDGTLIIMYFYDHHWRVATRGSCDASGPVNNLLNDANGFPMTFHGLFWNSAEYWEKGISKSGKFDPNLTYMFELTSPWNRIVCDYTKDGPLLGVYHDTGRMIYGGRTDVTGYAQDGSRITLIGVRDNISLEEIDVQNFADDFHYTVKEFPLTNFDEVIKAAEVLDPIKQEGFVVLDENFNRIKIKSPKYVALHHLRSDFGERRLMELIRLGDDGEFLSYFPEYTESFLKYKSNFENLLARMQLEWNIVNKTVGPDATQKEFALEAVKTKVPAYLFLKRKGQIETPIQFIKEMPIDKLLELVR